MKRFLLFILVISFLIQPVLAENVDLRLTYPETVEKGESIRISFEILNPTSMLWDGTVTIDEAFMNIYGPYIETAIDYQRNPFQFSMLNPRQGFKGTFVLTFKEDIPLDEVNFTVSLRCGIGVCRSGCRPYFTERSVNINLTQKEIEANLKLDSKEYSVYSGETLEIPFVIENVGDLQMRNLTVELQGDIFSEETINISHINPGRSYSDKIIVLIDETVSKTLFTSKVIVNCQDIKGIEGTLYENITINVLEKEEERKEEINYIEEEPIEDIKQPVNLLLYFFIFLGVVSVVAVGIFITYLFKKG